MLMPRAYQGSLFRYLWGSSVYYFRQWLRNVRLRFRQYISGNKVDAELAKLNAAFKQSIKERDWHSLRQQADAIAALGEKRSQAQPLLQMAHAYLRIGEYDRGASLLLKGTHLQEGKDAKEWTGQNIGDGTLLLDLIDDKKRGLGEIIRHLPFVAPTLARVKNVILITEPRLVPILARTFPGMEIRSGLTGIEEARREADAIASFEQLIFVFGRDPETTIKQLVPLRADLKLAEQFREIYAREGLPLIGISWGSKSYNKDVPNLQVWADFIEQFPAQFVSLQYGKAEADLPTLLVNDLRRIILDKSVDQYDDLDRFAAQIAALDGVISISNTVAHLTAALHVPSVVLVDDKFHTNWPMIESRSPWYPACEVLVKNGREWNEVLEQARSKLDTILKLRRK